MARARPRRCTPEEAAALVRPDDTLAVPVGPGQPGALLHALGERDDFTRLTVFAALLGDLYRLFTRPGVRLLSGFFGPVERGLRDAGHRVEYVPSDFRGFERIARRLHPRVMATAAAPPDASGRLSLSLHAGATTQELRRCGHDPERLLVVEVNPKLPRTLGLPPEHPHALDLEGVDVLLESDRDPATIDERPPTPVERAIAQHARPYLPSGSTLQTGIGGIPSAIAEALVEGAGDDYGIHTEMFTTGLMHLHAAGRVSNRKGLFDGFSAATFAAGTAELYAWLDGRSDVRFLPVGVVNDPAVVARNRAMVSINGALALDLYGQVVADVIGGRQYSGVGGHEDFVAGGTLGPGGRSLVCLPSTAGRDAQRVSRILAALPEGAVVTTPRHHVDVVVTEHGAAELAGLAVEERARRLVELAHPDFRAALGEQVDARLRAAP